MMGEHFHRSLRGAGSSLTESARTSFLLLILQAKRALLPPVLGLRAAAPGLCSRPNSWRVSGQELPHHCPEEE